jgi:hypothetical protein
MSGRKINISDNLIVLSTTALEHIQRYDRSRISQRGSTMRFPSDLPPGMPDLPDVNVLRGMLTTMTRCWPGDECAITAVMAISLVPFMRSMLIANNIFTPVYIIHGAHSAGEIINDIMHLLCFLSYYQQQLYMALSVSVC